MTVAELGDRMTARELAEWKAYYELEPFGDLRADYRTGLLASMLANLVRGKNDKPLTPKDFILHRDAQTTTPTTGAAAGASPGPGEGTERRASQLELIAALKGIGG